MSWEENGSWNHSAFPSLWLHLKTRAYYYSSFSQLHRWKELYHGHVLLSSLLTALLAPEITLCSWALYSRLLSAPCCSFCCFFLFFAGCFIIQVRQSDFNCAFAENFSHRVCKQEMHFIYVWSMSILYQCAKHVCALLLHFPTFSTWTKQLFPAHESGSNLIFIFAFAESKKWREGINWELRLLNTTLLPSVALQKKFVHRRRTGNQQLSQ